MRYWIALSFFLVARFIRADGIVIDRSCVDEKDSKIPQEFLDKARSLDVIFGHQSVGGNILQGLADLKKSDGKRYACDTPTDPKPDWFDKHGGFGQFGVGENENPVSKINDFQSRMMEAGYGKHVNVAMFKFCFVDVVEGGDSKPKEVFEAYRDAMEKLEKAFPKVRFVWWTVPLATEENAARNVCNKLIRDWCKAKGKTLFDLADIESNGGDSLLVEYTEDGGHLNETGRVRVARAWWWLMARIAGWDGK